MAFATYFDKNIQAASFLLNGLDSNLLHATLDKEVIGIAFDAKAVSAFEGVAGLKLTVQLLSRLYPTIALIALDDTARQYRAQLRAFAKSINPAISLTGNVKQATRMLVYGDTELGSSSRCSGSVWYVGSKNWNAKLSMKSPRGCGDSENPFGTGVAACLASANLFRQVFSAQLLNGAPDANLEFSVFELAKANSRSGNPKLPKVKLNNTLLVGAGAVGNGFLWAISQIDCTGTLSVIDPEVIEKSNLQRYAMTSAVNEGEIKAVLAKRWLAESKASHLQVLAYQLSWQGYLDCLADRRLDVVISAVDSAKARIEIQASLPRKIVNGWTQAGESGVSRHGFLDEMACLACLYLPQGTVPHQDELVIQGLRLPKEDQILKSVRQRLQQQTPTDREFLELIAGSAQISIERLLPYEGRPLQELYVDAICGGTILEFHQGQAVARADVPMAFQSTLTGILLAAELVAKRSSTKTITQIDLLRPFPDMPSHSRRKAAKPICICADEDFQAVYRKKYNLN